jgi:MoaA/NifB/PqqE/SkfB family radical SAM enzyme
MTAPAAVVHDRPFSDITRLHTILSLRCNYRCEFCFQPNFHDDLPEVVWRERLLPVYPNLTELVLHGGEPTAVAAFVEFCDFFRAVSPQTRLSIYTNGFRFGDYWRELMLTAGGYVNFSINAASRETYAAVNRRDHYDAVLDNVRTFRAGIRERDSQVRLDFSFVITERNCHELVDFLHLAAAYEVHQVRFFFDLEAKPPLTDELRDTIRRAYAARAELGPMSVWGLEIFEGRLLGVPVAAHHLESHGCTRTTDSLYVGVNGDASFCTFLHGRPIGNLVTQDLAEIWNSPAALAQRGAQLDGEWTYCVNGYCGPAETLRNTTHAAAPVTGAMPVLIPLRAVGGKRRAGEG